MVDEAKIRVGVIFGGRSGEHAVSLMSARSVLNALNPDKYAVTEIGITRQGQWVSGSGVLDALAADHLHDLEYATLLADPSRPGVFRLYPSESGETLLHLSADIDVVFPVLHGTFGEDGTLQGLLEMADLAYVGPGVLGAALAMDKAVFKDVMRANDIPVLEHVLVLRSEIEDSMEDIVNRAEQMAPYPFFTKPANMGSSVGITKCRTRSDLVEGILDAAQYDRRILVERGLPKVREIEVSVLGNDQPKASIPGEIVPAGDFYSYDSKYYDDRSQLLIPAPLSVEEAEWARETAKKAYQAIDCAGMARVDFLMNTQDGSLYLNEINTIPGFTQISMYPKLWEATGLPYSELLDQLIELALDRKRERNQTVREFRRS